MTDKLIAVRDGALLVREEGGGVAFPTRAELEAAGIDVSAAHDLRGASAIAVDRDVPGYEARGVRSLFGVLAPEDLAAAGSAMHVVRWAETSRVCGRCGTPTERVPNERAMKCSKCELIVYPRISPAIIVLVRRGDEALLARNARFPGAFYSTLAGFSEIGESLEETLVREVKEEVGVRRRRRSLLRQPAVAVSRLAHDRLHGRVGLGRDPRRREPRSRTPASSAATSRCRCCRRRSASRAD